MLKLKWTKSCDILIPLILRGYKMIDNIASPFYYRIHSPVLLIEFDHQIPVALWDRKKPRPGPVKTHIHTVVRTPNGNDYGKDLLKEHLEQHHKHEKNK